MAESNAVAAFFSRIVSDRGAEAFEPRPLVDTEGRPAVTHAFEAIDEQWGDMSTYLREACGLSDSSLQLLQDRCLE
jgi:protein tyrosine/serine phosphatase